MNKETKQTQIGTNVIPPTPITLVGTVSEGKENFMTVGWCSRVNANPPRIAIGIHQSHLTEETIRETGEFSVCIPSADMRQITDYCGVVSGKSTDKSELFTTFKGSLENAPLIEEAPINLECKLTDTLVMEGNTLFVGEIVGAWAKEGIMDGKKPSVEAMRPLILTMPDNRYWTLDNAVGKAWGDGIAYKKKLER